MYFVTKFVVKDVEEILIPPLPETSYICNNEIVQYECKGDIIYRDADYITITPQDVLSSFSLSYILEKKTKGRKLQRWKNYVNKYNIQLDNDDTWLLLRNNAILTLYVDGISVNDIDGEVVMKEYRIVGTGKNFDEEIKEVENVKPNLVVVSQKDIWYLITAYKIAYITPELRKALSKYVGVSRIECKEIKDNICYVS